MIATDTGGSRVRPTLQSIQVLRAVAAMLVVLFHLKLSANGYTGVDLFFVISGFIMGTVGTSDRPAQFLLKRIIRIVPLYWLVTFAMCALSLISGLMRNFEFTLADLLRSLFFVPYHSETGDIWPLVVPGWTLNFEIFFYVLFAIALMTTRPRLGTAAMIASLVLLGALVPGSDAMYLTYTSPLILEFAAGLAIASFGGRVPGWVAALILAVGTLFFVAMLVSSQPVAEGFERVFVVGLPAALIVAGCVFTERAGMWRSVRPIEYIGDISYSLYLTHGLVLSLVARLMPSGWVEAAVGIAISLAVAAATYHLFERPSTRWLNARWRRVSDRGRRRTRPAVETALPPVR